MTAKQVTRSVGPEGRLTPQWVRIYYRRDGATHTQDLSDPRGWSAEMQRLATHGSEVVEVAGFRGNRSWRLWPELQRPKRQNLFAVCTVCDEPYPVGDYRQHIATSAAHTRVMQARYGPGYHPMTSPNPDPASPKGRGWSRCLDCGQDYQGTRWRHRKAAHGEGWSERERAIADRWAAGDEPTLDEVGKTFGFSRERARQILSSLGVDTSMRSRVKYRQRCTVCGQLYPRNAYVAHAREAGHRQRPPGNPNTNRSPRIVAETERAIERLKAHPELRVQDVADEMGLKNVTLHARLVRAGYMRRGPYAATSDRARAAVAEWKGSTEVTRREVAARYGVSESTLGRWVRLSERRKEV